MPPSPAALLSETIAGGFGAVARLRHARAVHARGVAFAARASVEPIAGVPALARRRDGLEAVVRCSRSFDLPVDLLGIAIRLVDLHGPGEHQDVLVVSCLPGPVANPVPVPARDYTWSDYSSLMPVRVGGRAAFLGARSAVDPVARGGTPTEGARRAALAGRLEFELTWAPAGGRWRPWGRVVAAGAPLPPERTEALRFDPVLHSGPGLRLGMRPLADLRARAYRRSRDARPLARG